MDELFKKRMDVVMKSGSLGAKLVEDSNIISDKTFSNDTNFRHGMLYDCNMKELEEVDFKFEKVKKYSAEGKDIEYMIQFKSNFNPESKYKDLYYKDDGRERFGFYIDVLDRTKNIEEKWLIIGKDDRVAFDRYNVFKCNWCLEWVHSDKYYNCIGCVRDSSKSSVGDENNTLGGTTVDSDLSIIVPSNIDTTIISIGTRFIVSDNLINPQVYEVINVKDTTPLGVKTLYMKQKLFNSHLDVCGVINDMKDYEFRFDLPLEDLPTEYGGKYHMICNCIKSKGFPTDKPAEDIKWKLSKDIGEYLYVNGNAGTIVATPSAETSSNCEWHIFIDDVEYQQDELADYFEIKTISDYSMSIKAISKNMVKYIVKIAIYDELKTYYDSIEMEVRI